MKDFLKNMVSVERSLADEKGALSLFALFLREDAPGKWDLLVSAPWIEKNKQEVMKFIAGKVQKTLSKKELLNLSRIVIIEQSNPALSAFQSAIHVEHGDAEIQDSNFFGLQIKHAHVITSQRPQAA